MSPSLLRPPALPGPLSPPGVADASASAADSATLDPDLELVERWLDQGRESAFVELMDRHKGRLFRFHLYMFNGNAHDADDATQQTFVNLHRKGKSFRREARFYTFVYRIARNVALNMLRGEKRRRAYMDELAARQALEGCAPETGRDPELALEKRELWQRVSAEVQKLPLKLREPFVLYDFQKFSYDEIAEMLRLAQGTVKSRIHRARLRLRAALADLHEEDGR